METVRAEDPLWETISLEIFEEIDETLAELSILTLAFMSACEIWFYGMLLRN